MVKRHVNAGEQEPEQATFEKPSQKEHLLQTTDIITAQDELGEILKLNDDTVCAKMEVVGGEEEGRTLLNRLTLDPKAPGFFATRLYLKANGLEYKGDINIDTDHWAGRQCYALVVHVPDKNDKTKSYANIKEYNFEKKVEQFNDGKQEPAADQRGQEKIDW